MYSRLPDGSVHRVSIRQAALQNVLLNTLSPGLARSVSTSDARNDQICGWVDAAKSTGNMAMKPEPMGTQHRGDLLEPHFVKKGRWGVSSRSLTPQIQRIMALSERCRRCGSVAVAKLSFQTLSWSSSRNEHLFNTTPNTVDPRYNVNFGIPEKLKLYKILRYIEDWYFQSWNCLLKTLRHLTCFWGSQIARHSLM